jgi:hypothetical protein
MSTETLDQQKWQDMIAAGFETGSHAGSEEHCVMEAVAVATGHEKTEYPPCVGKLQARFMQVVNDSGRCTTTQLAEWAVRVVGTSDSNQVALANALADYAVKEFALGSAIDYWAQNWLSGADKSWAEAAAAAATVAWAAAAAARTAAWAGAADAAAADASVASVAAAAEAARAAGAWGAAEREAAADECYVAHIEAMIRLIEREAQS